MFMSICQAATCGLPLIHDELHLMQKLEDGGSERKNKAHTMSQHDLCAWWSQQILQVLPNQSFTNWSYGNLNHCKCACVHTFYLALSPSLHIVYLALSPSYLPHTVSPSFSLLSLSPLLPHILSLSLSLTHSLCDIVSLSLFLPATVSPPLLHYVSPTLSFSLPHMLSPHPSLSLPLSHSVSVSLSLQSIPCTRETTVQTHTPLDTSRPHLQTEKEERHHGIGPCQSVITNNTCSMHMPIGHNKQRIIFNEEYSTVYQSKVNNTSSMHVNILNLKYTICIINQK